MSLSQKHMGKVLVPWFNTSEWKTVFELIYSGDTSLQKKAVDILDLWKIRTPFLPAGVEGTLIILKALLTNCCNLREHEVCLMYSTSVLRFLNICATTNEKQGTFTRSAKENDLPEWLVNIRHDIAHDNKIPSLSMLKLSLDYCFQWVKERYWEEHYNTLKDFVVTEVKKDKKQYNLIYCYVFVNLNLYLNNSYDDLDDTLKSLLKSVLQKKFRSLHPDLSTIVYYVHSMLQENKKNEDFKTSLKEISDVIVKQNVLLLVHCEVNESGFRYIPVHFRDIWSDLFSLFIKTGSLFFLLDGLFVATKNDMYDTIIRETAATWILEIFRGFLRLKYIEEEMNSETSDTLRDEKMVEEDVVKIHPELEGAMIFPYYVEPPVTEAELFLEKVIKDPGECTLIYLGSLTEFTSSDVSKTVDLVKTMITVKEPKHDSEIITVEDLVNNIEDMDTESIHNDMVTDEVATQGRWRRIDAKQFEGCPLGVLPYQDRTKNPLLVL